MPGKHGTPEQRFWQYVNKTACCWFWTGATIKSGRRRYGVFRYGSGRGDKRQTTASNYALRLKLGRDLLPNMDACHNCPCGDKELCVHPDHLWEGTKGDNVRDTIAKGRQAPVELTRRPGSKNGNAKLSEADVLVIHERLAAGDRSKDIARVFGVVPSLISNISTGRSWRHVHPLFGEGTK